MPAPRSINRATWSAPGAGCLLSSGSARISRQLATAYSSIEEIQLEGSFYRHDIAASRCAAGGELDVQIGNVLANRYASAEMRDAWSTEGKIISERRLWLAVLGAQHDLGVDFGGDDPAVVIKVIRG